MAGRMISGAAALAELVRAAGETETAGLHRTLPVVPELSSLLPGHGLRRGSTVAVSAGQSATAAGGTSLLLALLSEASRTGSWCAVVGVPSLGAIAAAESGIALDRLALVPDPGPDWPTVVAALIDGVDVIVLAVPGGVSASIASRLVARARQRGSVLVPYGDWSGADVTLRVLEGRWEGLDEGHGRLRRRQVRVLARGRGAAARPKEITMWMPGVTIRPLTLPPPTGPTPANQSTVDIPTRPHLVPVPTGSPQPPSSPAASADRPRPASVPVAVVSRRSLSPAASEDRLASASAPAASPAASANRAESASVPAAAVSSAAGVDRRRPASVSAGAVSRHSMSSAASADRSGPDGSAAVVSRPPGAGVDRPGWAASVSAEGSGVVSQLSLSAGAATDESVRPGAGPEVKSDVDGGRVLAFPAEKAEKAERRGNRPAVM